MKKRVFGFVLLCCIVAAPLSAAAEEEDAAKEMEAASETEEIDEGALAWETGEIVSTDLTQGAMSKDLYSFQVKIDGELYQFPMKYEEFIEKGWKLDGVDAQKTMSPGSYGSVMAKKGRILAGVTLMNFGMNTKTLDECYVAGIDLDESYMENQMTFELPKGIVYDVSTMDDVEEAYGPASDLYKTREYTKLTYESSGFYRAVEIYVDGDEKKVKRVSMTCLTLPEDFEEDEISGEIPAIVSQYQEPAELGEDVSSCIVKIDESLYQIPAPVSAFLENGWNLIYDDNSEVIAGKDTGDGYYLGKSQQRLRIGVKNYDDNATAVENCFVTEIYNQNFSAEIPIELQKGITFGVNSADLEKALEGTTYEKEESNTLIRYFIPSYDDKEDGIELCLSKAEDKIVKISIQREPKTANLFD